MATQQKPHVANGSDRKPREIHRHIEETRSEMDHTLDEIGDRLHPKHFVDEVVEWFSSDSDGSSTREAKRRARTVGKGIVRKIKQHPVPALLCGGGLAWLLLEDEDDPRQTRLRRQWDDLDEQSGSFVDARTGASYGEAYGKRWRGAAAWDHEYDFSDNHEDEQAWTQRAQKTLDEIQSSLGDQSIAARDKLRGSASKLLGVSGRRRSEIHSQWDDLAEHSGSFVDARTGQPYDDSYGQRWQALVCCDIAASEDWSDEDEKHLSDKANESLSKMQKAAGDTSRSVKQRLASLSDHLSDFVSHSQQTSSHYGSRAKRKLARAAGATRDGFSSVGRAGRSGATATRRSAVNGYQQTRDATEQAFESSPLAVGAAVLGLGLIGGLLLPRTRREDEAMGPSSDRLKRNAGQAGREAATRGREVAESTLSAGMDEMERQGMTPEQIGKQARQTGSELKDVVNEHAPTKGDLRDKVQQVAARSSETAKEESQRHADEMSGESATKRS